MANQLTDLDELTRELDSLRARIDRSAQGLADLASIPLQFQELRGEYLKVLALVQTARRAITEFEGVRSAARLAAEEQCKEAQKAQADRRRAIAEMSMEVKGVAAEHDRLLHAELQRMENRDATARSAAQKWAKSVESEIEASLRRGENAREEHLAMTRKMEAALREFIDGKMRVFGLLFIAANVLAMIALAASLAALFR